MGLLQRLFGGTRAEPETARVAAYMLVPDRAGAELEVVGEQSYQPNLLASAGGRNRSGPINREHVAALMLEPENQHDVNAICVRIDGRRIGYLSREDALRYGPVMRAAAARDHIIACQAYLKGGWDNGRGDQGSIGVTLRLGSPGETLMDVLGEDVAVSQDHPWIGHMVAFTGESNFQLTGVALDREWCALLARKAGMHVHPRVTKKVQLLVDCDAGGHSANQLKAIEYGIPVTDEATFWAALSLPVEALAWKPARPAWQMKSR